MLGKFFKKKPEPVSKEETIKSIRESLESFGIDTSQYTGEEIEESIITFGTMAAKVGCTAAEAVEVFKLVGLTGKIPYANRT